MTVYTDDYSVFESATATEKVYRVKLRIKDPYSASSKTNFVEDEFNLVVKDGCIFNELALASSDSSG